MVACDRHRVAWIASLVGCLGACAQTPAASSASGIGLGGNTAAPPIQAAAGVGQPPLTAAGGMLAASTVTGSAGTNAMGVAGIPAPASVGAPSNTAAPLMAGTTAVPVVAGAAGMRSVALPMGGAAAAGATGSVNEDSSACVKALKPKCQMRDKSACSSYLTADVGTLVKATEVPLGPYGATMEQNLGKEFAIPQDASESSCALIASSFGEPADVTAETGDLKDVDLTLYTVYRPSCMKEGETYPVITWGNGTCGQTEGYGALLRYVASYGYIVFAANSRYTGSNGAMTKALDFAASANKDPKSNYYNRLDLTKIGAMGHSQGGGATVTAAKDARISSVIIWNASTSATKPFLAISGDSDITSFTAASMSRDIMSATQPAAFLYYHKVPQTGSVSGHLTLMIQPERVVEATRAWWDYMLKGDAKARDFFIGPSCGLCGKKEDFEYGQNGLK